MKLPAMIRIALFLGLLIPLAARAQRPVIGRDTISWVCTGDKNLNTGESFPRSNTFISYGTAKIDMLNGNMVHHFVVTSTEGSWDKIINAGQILYHVSFANQPGIITIGRNADQTLYLILDMRLASKDGIYNQYTIDHFTKQ